MTEPVDQTYTITQAQDDLAQTAGLVDRLLEAHTKTDSTDPPNQPSGGLTSYSFSGHEKYVSSADGNAYNTGRQSTIVSSGTTINSLSDITITSSTQNVSIGTYHVRGYVKGTNGGTTANQAIGLTSGATTSNVNVAFWVGSATSNNLKQMFEITSLPQRGSTGNQSPGEVIVAHFHGTITFTSSGTLSLTGSCVTSAADTWTFNNRSFLMIEPVT